MAALFVTLESPAEHCVLFLRAPSSRVVEVSLELTRNLIAVFIVVVAGVGKLVIGRIRKTVFLAIHPSVTPLYVFLVVRRRLPPLTPRCWTGLVFLRVGNPVLVAATWVGNPREGTRRTRY